MGPLEWLLFLLYAKRYLGTTRGLGLQECPPEARTSLGLLWPAWSQTTGHLVWYEKRAFRCYRTNTGTSSPSSIHMAYSVLGLGQNKAKPSSSLVCQFPSAVPGIPQLKLTTWHWGSINQERLYNKHRIPTRKIQTYLHIQPSLSSLVTSVLHQLLLWTIFQLILKQYLSLII